MNLFAHQTITKTVGKLCLHHTTKPPRLPTIDHAQPLFRRCIRHKPTILIGVDGVIRTKPRQLKRINRRL